MKKQKRASQSEDVDALAFNPDDTRNPRSKHFIPREGSRKRGLEISFDPDKHKEWVTGFRKRKNERKTAGMKVLEQKAKEDRLQSRLERKQQRKRELQLPDDYGVHDSDVEEPEAHEVVTDTAVFDTGGGTATVTTAALDFDPDIDAAQALARQSSGSEAASSDGAQSDDGEGADGGPAFPGDAHDESEDEEAQTQPSGQQSSAPQRQAGKHAERAGSDGKKKKATAANRLAKLKEKKGGKKKHLQPVQAKGKKGKGVGKGAKGRGGKRR